MKHQADGVHLTAVWLRSLVGITSRNSAGLNPTRIDVGVKFFHEEPNQLALHMHAQRGTRHTLPTHIITIVFDLKVPSPIWCEFSKLCCFCDVSKILHMLVNIIANHERNCQSYASIKYKLRVIIYRKIKLKTEQLLLLLFLA